MVFYYLLTSSAYNEIEEGKKVVSLLQDFLFGLASYLYMHSAHAVLCNFSAEASQKSPLGQNCQVIFDPLALSN